MDLAPLIAGFFALAMAVFVWWSGRRDKLDAAAAVIAKDERDRANAKADRAELAEDLAAKLKASQLNAAQVALQPVAEEFNARAVRAAAVGREHVEMVAHEAAVALKKEADRITTQQTKDASVAADSRRQAAIDLEANTKATQALGDSLAENTAITRTAADQQQALVDQFAHVNQRVDQVQADAEADRRRVEQVARSHAAAHVTEAERLITEVDAATPPPIAPPVPVPDKES